MVYVNAVHPQEPPVSVGPHLLGWLPPPDFRHVECHPYEPMLGMRGVAVTIKTPRYAYWQGNMPADVAYSVSRVMSFHHAQKFDAPWLDARICQSNGGAYLRDAFDVLREEGHREVLYGQAMPVSLGGGVQSNQWATNVDGIRTALASHCPVSVGSAWPAEWFTPIERTSGGEGETELWLANQHAAVDEGRGHAYALWAASDRRQAVGLVNTWIEWGRTVVWMDYATMDWMLANGEAECSIAQTSTTSY